MAWKISCACVVRVKCVVVYDHADSWKVAVETREMFGLRPKCQNKSEDSAISAGLGMSLGAFQSRRDPLKTVVMGFCLLTVARFRNDKYVTLR